MSRLPPAVKPIVEAAKATIREAAPSAEEISYGTAAPHSKSTVWKLVRYAVGGQNVVGVGTLTAHSMIYFYRGTDLDDGSGLLQGGGKQMRFIRLNSPADARKPEVRRLVRKAFELAT